MPPPPLIPSAALLRYKIITTADYGLQCYSSHTSHYLLQCYKQYVAEADLETENIRCSHHPQGSHGHHLQVDTAPDHADPRAQSTWNKSCFAEFCQLSGQQRWRLRNSELSSHNQTVSSEGQQEEVEAEAEAGGSLQQ